ncbi:aldehyde ferredoxin oxidoreductase family protein [Thermodesulfobacteriota bacterium]
MSKLYGYAGKLLRVDLTSEKITDEELNEETARKYIGGTGLGAKYLYEEVPAGVQWSDEGNRLIMASGPIGGTKMGGTGTFSVVTKGPLTNGIGASQANGFFGAFLRFSGYDGIILQGKASRWVYLCIHEGKVELRDAGHLLGKDTYETVDHIKGEFDQSDRGMSVASIGPAGENLVKYACIMVDKGHAAAHNGIGAVMGSKRLKAVAITRSKARPPLKDEEGLSAIAEDVHTKRINNPIAKGGTYSWGTLNGVVRLAKGGDGVLPIKNYSTNIWDIEPEKLEKFGGPYIRSNFKPKAHPCWSCRFHHVHMITITEGPYAGLEMEEPEYEQFASWGPVIGQDEVATAMMLSYEVDRLGMDTNEAGWVIGMVMECYEKGVITREDCDGLDMTWGNAEATREMLQKIAHRQGFGDTLAEGAMRAAQRIGGEAPNFAIHTMKGNTPRTHDHRAQWPMIFDTCVSQMGTDEGFTMQNAQDLGLTIKPAMGPNTSVEDALTWNVQTKGAVQFEDSLGICKMNTNTNITLLSQLVRAATGWDFSFQELMITGKRIVNLLRAFNIRHGHTAERDAPSPRYGLTPVDGPNKGKTIMPHWNELRSNYYEQMGWDRETGKPLPDTLKNLGLEHAILELWET